MSIQTTHYTTREIAINTIKKVSIDNEYLKHKIKEHKSGKKLKHHSDEQLENLLEIAVDDIFKNFMIVSPDRLEECKQENKPYY